MNQAGEAEDGNELIGADPCNAADESASASAKPEATAAESASEKPEAKADWKVGDICVGASTKRKESYHNQQCDIVGVLARHCKVKLLLGAA